MSELIPGIIGGMGPEATVDLMHKIISHTEALDDCDHIRCIVDNNPKIPSRIAAILGDEGEDPGPVMAEVARSLEAYGADFLVIPCNTAHYYYNTVANAVQIPVVNMIHLMVDLICIEYPELKKVGVLGSTTIIKTDLYRTAFASRGVQVVYPDDAVQETLFEVIRGVKRGDISQENLDKFHSVAAHLAGKGVEIAILGCTELGIIADEQLPIKWLDAADVLASEIVALAKKVKQLRRLQN